MADFNGLGLHLGNLSRLSSAKSRSISPENFTGEKGRAGMSTDGPAAQMARDLGQGWKVSPYVIIAAGQPPSPSPTSRAQARSSRSG